MKQTILLLLCLIILPISAADLHEQLSKDKAAAYTPVDARFRISYEVIPLADGFEDMGVVGTHFDWHPFESFEPFYAGFGFYSAATGEEGGFFTFGYTLGLDYEFYDNFHADAGAYLGGGAGEYIGFSNGGMMVHTHAALSYEFKGVEVAMGIAWTDFPDTEKNKEYKSDLHPYAGINITSEVWSKSSDSNYSSELPDFNGLFKDIRITPTIVFYDIDDKPVKHAKRYKGNNAYQDDFPMLGIQLDKFLTDGLFVSMEAYGAVSSAAGYAAIQMGLGYDLKLLDFLAWESKMVAGFAGDSRIDTGGGFILQPMTGLRLQMTPSFSFKTLVGRTYAPSGLFEATTYEAGLSWQASQPVPKKGSYLFSSENFDNLAWVFSPSFKMYFPFDSTHGKNQKESEKEIGLIGAQLSVPLNSWFSLIGSTHWAMTGNQGSYAEGLFGAKLSTPSFSPLKIRAGVQGEIGAGAGADINTESGGYVIQALASLEAPISEHTGLEIDAGQMRTSDGKFKANTIKLSLNINLNLIFKKH